MRSGGGQSYNSVPMKTLALCLLAASALPAVAQSATPVNSDPASGERLGTVSFAVSCTQAVQAPFRQGVALLHDFWYAEAGPQFAWIAKADPTCAMAHWGTAMSVFHQIWDRPDEAELQQGRDELRKAESLHAKTARERAYIEALSVFYKPGYPNYEARITAYSDAMGKLYRDYPGDVDAGAFYALSLLAARAPSDTTLTQEHKAMAVLTPLFAKVPDNPGLVHYIIHSCDNPSMAADGLAAAERYGEIAPSGAHAVHMAGHIFARLGMWPQDIESQLGSIAASEAAEARHESGLMDEPHSYDFLMYAYLQSGQDAQAQQVLMQSAAAVDRIDAMPGMGGSYRMGMSGYYRTKFPVFYALEMRDWQAASALDPVAGAAPEDAALTWWARAIADGHLHHADGARADLARFDGLMSEVRKGRNAYLADATGSRIARGEIEAWGSFAAGQESGALASMRAAADLQDKVGQGEVDIPAREMLGDMLLEMHRPQEALAEYRVALKLSPNRFNGLYHAGLAAEQAGDGAAAAGYFAALMQSTNDGAHSTRPELAHAKGYLDARPVTTAGGAQTSF